MTLLLVCVGAIGVFAASASAATATTYTVNNLTDDPPSSGNDGVATNCDPGNANTCTLRDAITAANANSDSDPGQLGSTVNTNNDVINVPAGTYQILGGNQLPIITHNVQINGPGANLTTVNGTDNTPSTGGVVEHVFEIGNYELTQCVPITIVAPSKGTCDGGQLSTVYGNAPTVQISGLTATGGIAGFMNESDGGGGIVIDALLGLDSASTKGGQLPPGPTLNLLDSSVTGNTVVDTFAGGGGILVEPGATLNALRDSIIDNAALFSEGGSLLGSYEPLLSAGAGVFNAGTTTITDSTLGENSTNCASGAFICSEGPIGSLLGPNGQGGPGGAIFQDLSDAGPLTLLNDTIANNVGTGQGGGVAAESFYANACGIIPIIDCSAPRSAHWGQVKAAAQAGALKSVTARAYDSAAQSKELSLPIAQVNVQNTILSRNSVLAAFNSPAQASYQDCFSEGDLGFGAINDLGNNLDYDQTNSCGFNSAYKGDFVSTDPGLPTQLKLNGGKTPNYTPALTSPVVDAANNSVCGTAAGQSGGFDQRGLARISGPSCDMGAVEAQYPPPPVAAVAPSTQASAPSVSRPTIALSGLRKQCSRSQRLTVTSTARSAGAHPTTRVYLDGRRITLRHTTRVHVVINLRHLRRGRHTLRIRVTANGRVTTRVIRFTTCRAAVSPRFTG